MSTNDTDLSHAAARERAAKTDYSILFRNHNPATWLVTFWDTFNIHTVTYRNGVWACDEVCESRIVCRHVGAAMLEVERMRAAGGRLAETAAFIMGEISVAEFAPKPAPVKSADEVFGVVAV